MRLDFSRPYSEVIGRPGVTYEQDGINFRVDGSLAEMSPPGPKVAPSEPVQAPPRPRAPRKHTLNASTALRHQFGELEEFVPQAPQRDVLADYRDPQGPDGSMKMEPKTWADGV